MPCQNLNPSTAAHVTIGYCGVPTERSWEALAGILAEHKRGGLTAFLSDSSDGQFTCPTVDDSAKLFVLRAGGKFTVAIVTHGHGAPQQKMWGALKGAGVESIHNITDASGTKELAIWTQMTECPPL